MNLYSDPRNLATDGCPWKLFLTRVHQILPDLTPVPILLLPTPPPSLESTEVHEIKVTKNKRYAPDIRYFGWSLIFTILPIARFRLNHGFITI